MKIKQDRTASRKVNKDHVARGLAASHAPTHESSREITRLLRAHNTSETVSHANKTQARSKLYKTVKQQPANQDVKVTKYHACHVFRLFQNCFSSSSRLSLENRFAPSVCTTRPLACSTRFNSNMNHPVFVGPLQMRDIVMYSKASAYCCLRCEMLLRLSCFSNFVELFLFSSSAQICPGLDSSRNTRVDEQTEQDSTC